MHLMVYIRNGGADGQQDGDADSLQGAGQLRHQLHRFLRNWESLHHNCQYVDRDVCRPDLFHFFFQCNLFSDAFIKVENNNVEGDSDYWSSSSKFRR
jgi:hypothetical protein